MCRYAMTTYKPLFVCFSCRKSFKRRLPADTGYHGEEKPAKCPQCGLLMVNMGLDFKPPKQRDLSAWSAASSLYEAGITFHSCGCSGPGYRPRQPDQLRAFFESTLSGYQSTYTYWKNDTDCKPSQRTKALASWQRRIIKLQAALDRL